uniref:GrpE protein homolog n=1 Tax=Chaetoceros debilis TaxID=122233 RepID=A0A7S3V4N6_9STRA|mmetsp:Transcript_24275/g.36012  ORF Transcript_24275/g.36012 Transcript_24275/m.36012 type:complete len:271 (+) Transcript_24275:86-898(+)
MIFKISPAALSAVLLVLPTAQGFGVSSSNVVSNTNMLHTPRAFIPNLRHTSTVLFETEGELSEEEPVAEEAVAEEEAEEPVDDEAETIKKEIVELENTLKNKNREINNIEKLGEQYTEAGYARKVAEMESINRSRKASAADGKTTARAGVLSKFLPIVDELKRLTELHEGDEFAGKYKALSSDFNGAMGTMGVAEFTLGEGEFADATRVSVVVEEHSETIVKGSVIAVIEGSTGYEIEGNVMRPVDAVVSLGPEPAEEEESAGDAEASEE